MSVRQIAVNFHPHTLACSNNDDDAAIHHGIIMAATVCLIAPELLPVIGTYHTNSFERWSL
jgi:hypothetical protein